MRKPKTRLIVSKGPFRILLKVQDIVCIYRDKNLIFVVDKEDKRYLFDSALSSLEEDLDPAVFFRANRQYILNVHYVKSYTAFEKIKLKVDLSIPGNFHVIVSQETAPAFKKWVREEF